MHAKRGHSYSCKKIIKCFKPHIYWKDCYKWWLLINMQRRVTFGYKCNFEAVKNVYGKKNNFWR